MNKEQFIRFSDIPGGTPIYCADDIERAWEFHTKDEWINEWGIDDGASFAAYAWREYGLSDAPWHTAQKKVATTNLEYLIEIASDEMFEDWYDHVFSDVVNDEVVKAGVERLNEIFANHPSYYEDKTIIFDDEGEHNE
jgi:hypothetical protein